jgi:hypothetical protein
MNELRNPNLFIKFVFLLIFIIFITEANIYRILVVVTPRAVIGMGNTWRDQIIQGAITTQNIAYIKSPTADTAQIAGILLAENWTQSVIATDLNRLRDTSDGFIDTIRTLRRNYAADIVAIYGYYYPDAGQAVNIGADSNSAFYAADYWSSSNSYSASHEMGHLFGAAHDTAHTYPGPIFPYGYGMWVTYNGYDFGTIMSYYGIGGRQQCYSNPDSFFILNGQNAGRRGTILKCNVTRLHRERSNTMATLRSPKANVTIDHRTLKYQELGDVVATNSITVNGPDTIKDSADLRLRATNSVTINSGFAMVGQNAKLTITTGSGALAKRGNFHNKPEPGPVEHFNSPLKPELRAIYENDKLVICYSLAENAPVNVRLFDLKGRIVFEKFIGTKEQGYYNVGINELMSSGPKVYMMELMAGKAIMMTKIIGIH